MNLRKWTIRLALALCFGGLLGPLAGSARAAPVFKVDGATVEVDTERYWVRIDGLSITGIRNKLTGEECVRAAAPAAAAASAPAGTAGLAIESLRPGVPTSLFTIGPRTQTTVERTPAGAVTLVHRGLHNGNAFEPAYEVRLGLYVDPATGDLVLEPAAHVEIPERFGARDAGLLHVALQFGPLAEELRLVIPASDGFAVTKSDVPADWSYQAHWPQSWEAALLIAESATGSLGLWADEPALHYGRTLGISRVGGWRVTLAFETADQIQRCTDLKGAAWRLNVFAGNWLKPAARYREQSAKQWPDLQPLKSGHPAWADKIRIFITGPTPDPQTAARFAALVPRDSIAVFTCQEWLRGWNEGDIAKLNKGMDYFPNWPLDNPTHYEARPDMPAKFKAVEELGMHVFPYTNPTIIDLQHPWIQKLGDRHFFAYRFWQRIHPELCQDVVGRYGVSGIYEDCSWVIGRHTQGEPEGFNWYNGSAAMRQYFRQLLPEVAVCGERNNEVTWRGQRFALSITQWPGQAHPIVTYLCSPYLRMWNLQLQPAGFDADDIRGWITPWPFVYEENPIQERRILRQRGLVFAREQLESVWPDTWDPAVLHYFRGASGVEYRFLRDRGTRFVKVTPAGLETVYWRLGGVPRADVGALGIEGWIAYDGTMVHGLNPKAVYPVFADIARSPVTLASLPDGFHIDRCVIRDGFWVVHVAADDPQAKPREVRLRLRAQGVTVKGACGATLVKAEPGATETEMSTTLPGGFGVYWTTPVALGEADPLLKYPARNTIHRRDTGLISQYGADLSRGTTFNQECGAVEANEEGTAAWLVTVPEFSTTADGGLFLQFAYGSEHPYGDGANYQVRINGRTVWKRYRAEQGKPDPRNPAQPQPVPVQHGQVDLKAWAGQTVVLELVSDGNAASVSESVCWHNPRTATEPDHTAESDDAGASAKKLEPSAGLIEP